MKHLIDKDALVAEINQRIEEYKSHKIDNSYHDGLIFALEDLRDDFIDTLEVKEVDLEKEIETHLKECLDVKFPTTDIELIKKDVAYTAKKFFELGLKAQKGEKAMAQFISLRTQGRCGEIIVNVDEISSCHIEGGFSYTDYILILKNGTR